MSSPEETFVARVNAITAVSALIGGRVYPIQPPEGVTLPCVVYELSGDNPINSAGGATGTHETHIAAHLLASTYANVKALAAAMLGDESTTSPSGLSGWADTSGNIWHLDSQRDAPGELITGQDVREYQGVDQEYTVWN
ncbi:MAG: DUF3168 domain-containing protein [Sulfurimonas sp.]|jgi:hypothetical protein